MRFQLGSSLGAVLGALALVGTASAGPPGHWDVFAQGRGVPGGDQDPGLVRSGDGILHVGWKQRTGPLTEALFQRAITAAGALGSTSTMVADWSFLTDPAFVLDPGGGIRAFYGGATASGTAGVFTATAPSAGAPWSPPTQLTSSFAGTPAATLASDGTPFAAWHATGGGAIAVKRGVTPAEPALFSVDSTQTRVNIVGDASGRLWVAACTSRGLLVQQIDRATGAAVPGTAAQLEGSVSPFEGQGYVTCILDGVITQRTPMAARTGGGVFVAGTSGYPSQPRVLVWRVDAADGARRPLVVANSPGGTDWPALAAAPDGRLWVAWREGGGPGGRVVARRSNRSATAFGAPVVVVPPRDFLVGVVGLSAQASRGDLIAHLAKADGTATFQHTQVLPGLTLTSAKRTFALGKAQTIVFRALDAGEPVAGVRVSLGRRSATTNAAGLAKILVTPRRGVRTIRATATKPGYTKAQATLRGR